jgi:hypothetical protein
MLMVGGALAGSALYIGERLGGLATAQRLQRTVSKGTFPGGYGMAPTGTPCGSRPG